MRIVLATMILAAAFTAEAKPVYVDFTVRQSAPLGDAPSGVYRGTWSYDDKIVKPGGLFEDPFKGAKLDSFSFSWLGEKWHPGNVRLARLEFDADGELRSWIIGAIAVSGGCGNVGALDCVGVPAHKTDFYLVGTRAEPGIPPPELIGVGVRRGSDTFIEASGSFTVRGTAVSTPASLSLFGSTLLMFVGFRRIARTRGAKA